MAQPKILPASIYTTNDPTSFGDTTKVLMNDFKVFPRDNTPSPPPGNFRINSLTAFDAYTSSDFPPSREHPYAYYTGITCLGELSQGFQLAVNWNAEELHPTDMYIRINDNTSDPAVWGQWTRVHIGDITFTTSTAAPTGGLPGDIVYDTTTPAMWMNEHGNEVWRKLTKLFVKDNTVWRDVQQKWVNNNGTWVKVFQA